MLIQTGIPDKEAIEAVTPDETRFLKGAVAIAECFQKIPCNPCTKACVKKQSTSSRISTRHPKLILMCAMAAVPVC